MNLNIKSLMVALTILYSVSSFAQLPDEELFKRSMDNVSHNTLTCFAYYNLVKKALENTQNTDQNTLDIYQATVDDLIGLASEALAMTGRSTEMGAKVLKARISMAFEGMQDDIDNDFSNISILFVKYGDECQLWAKNPNIELVKTIKKTWEDNGADPTEVLKNMSRVLDD